MAIVGVVTSLAMQFASDVISYSISGKWTGTWQSYVGAAAGGVINGILTLTGLNWVAVGIGSFISTSITVYDRFGKSNDETQYPKISDKERVTETESNFVMLERIPPKVVLTLEESDGIE